MESVSYKDSLETIFLKVYVPQVPWELMHCEADCAQHGQLFKQRKMTPLTDFLILTQHKTWECWTFHLRMPCAARCFAFEPHARPVRWPSRQFSRREKNTPLTHFLILTHHKTCECWTFHLKMPCAAPWFFFFAMRGLRAAQYSHYSWTFLRQKRCVTH